MSASRSSSIVLLKRISFAAICAPHGTPYKGSCAIAYIPKGKVVGFGRLNKLVKFLASQKPIQEDLTQRIVEEVMLNLAPQALAVVVTAKHKCMLDSGVPKGENEVTIIALKGSFTTANAGELILQLAKN